MIRRNILRDERGAILTFGVFLAPFLVAAVYYLVGIANTLMQREGIQAAADASAFAPSVVSARGMNAIAVLNVLMMAVMSVVIPVRAMLPAYQEVASWGCPWYDPCRCMITADAQRAAGQLAIISIGVEQRADKLLTAFSDAQDLIAEHAGEAAAVAAEASTLRTHAFVEPGAEVYSPAMEKDGCRLGLPVEEDSFRTVCKRTRPYVEEIAVRLAGQTLRTFGYCLSGPDALGVAQPDLLTPENPMMCREARNAPCSDGGSSGPHPKKVFSKAKNGSDYMQYWTRVRGHSNDAPRSGVAISARSKGSDVPRELDVGFAESEFYFDCSGSWSSCNSKENAMWDTRWTARLRRVHAPSISFRGSSVVSDDLADGDRWAAVRDRWLAQRRDFTTGGPADTDAARTLMNGQSEGPLQ